MEDGVDPVEDGVVVDQEVAAAVVCQLQAAAAAGAAAMCRQSRSRGNAHRIWQQKRHISIARWTRWWQKKILILIMYYLSLFISIMFIIHYVLFIIYYLVRQLLVLLRGQNLAAFHRGWTR